MCLLNKEDEVEKLCEQIEMLTEENNHLCVTNDSLLAQADTAVSQAQNAKKNLKEEISKLNKKLLQLKLNSDQAVVDKDKLEALLKDANSDREALIQKKVISSYHIIIVTYWGIGDADAFFTK